MSGRSDRLRRLGYDQYGTGETNRDTAYGKAKQARREGKTATVEFEYGPGTYVVYTKKRKSHARIPR